MAIDTLTRYSTAETHPGEQPAGDPNPVAARQGIVWRGTYGAVGPNGGQGVNLIELGFVQHVKIVTQSATYADGTTLAAQYDGT